MVDAGGNSWALSSPNTFQLIDPQGKVVGWQGEFYVPMATTEGTLVASYNRGMKLLRACGGVKTTITADNMQRAPVFRFADARGARDFSHWLSEHEAEVRDAAEATTKSGRLVEIERYTAARFCFTRFDYTTGDAAGQNMTGKATREACEWIKANYPGELESYTLEGSMATDKKHSHINLLKTRGKRVVAEAIIPNAVLQEQFRVSTEDIYRTRMVAALGSNMAGAINNGSHSANAITALFIACGQDVANVSESHAAMVYAELREGGDYYYSITIPSLIVGTFGGGTNIGTQAECLDMLGCRGRDGVMKFAEIVAATVLCGELSLGAAVVADEWVSSHDAHGRNR